jgi:hypothetical protein
MNNGNGMQKICIQNNVISSHNKKKKAGSHKWTKIGGMVNKYAGLDPACTMRQIHKKESLHGEES